MTLCVTQSPINPDTRTLLEKLFGEEYRPVMHYTDAFVWEVLHKASTQNYHYSEKWRGKIGKITLRPPKSKA